MFVNQINLERHIKIWYNRKDHKIFLFQKQYKNKLTNQYLELILILNKFYLKQRFGFIMIIC